MVTLDEITHICLNLREIDKKEVFATRGDNSPVMLAHETNMAAKGGLCHVAWYDGKPCAIVGVTPMWGWRSQKNWLVYSFGTDDWKHTVVEIMRYGRKFSREAISKHDGIRLNAFSIEDHKEAHKWMEATGATKEAVLPYWGRDGETFYLYSWFRNSRHFLDDPHWTEYSHKEINCQAR